MDLLKGILEALGSLLAFSCVLSCSGELEILGKVNELKLWDENPNNWILSTKALK